VPAARVDLNSDVGEGFGPWRMGDDESLLEVVTTVNVACGFHAGDPLIMARTVALAKERGVAVGAHPGLNDLWGFGRRRIEGDAPEDVAAMVVYQVGALRGIAARAGVQVGHVKLHGALSNAAATDARLADAVAEALHDLDAELTWLVPGGSEMAAAGERAGLRTVHEVFADRAYDDAGDLLPRSLPGAVIDDPDQVAARAVAMVRDQGVRTATGALVPLRVESICVHGDTLGAVAAARLVRSRLETAGIEVATFGRARG
jgi:UPF0271 protein